MQRPLGSPPLSECISRFESELRRAVWEIALTVMAQELSRRTAAERAPRATRTRAVSSRRAAAGRRARTPSKPTVVEVQTSFETLLTAPAPGAVAATDSAPATADTSVAPAAAPQPPGKRGRLAWTRERVVEELANWLMQDPVIDAATLSRRGQSSLVAAARRLFGRFDAALNAANLHLAELYPDGPPKRGRMSAAA